MLKKIAPWAGMAGAAVFPLSFTLQGWLRPGYSPVRRYVSELSIGPWGWVQIVNFMFLGLCLLVFALGISQRFPRGAASRWGPRLLLAVAVCYFFSGPFVTDPLSMFSNQRSAHGMVHGILGALVFSLSPVCCFVFLRRFRRDPSWRPLQTVTLFAGILMAVTVVLMKLAQPQASPLNAFAGVIQRCSLLSFYAWIFIVALHFRKGADTQ